MSNSSQNDNLPLGNENSEESEKKEDNIESKEISGNNEASPLNEKIKETEPLRNFVKGKRKGRKTKRRKNKEEEELPAPPRRFKNLEDLNALLLKEMDPKKKLLEEFNKGEEENNHKEPEEEEIFPPKENKPIIEEEEIFPPKKEKTKKEKEKPKPRRKSKKKGRSKGRRTQKKKEEIEEEIPFTQSKTKEENNPKLNDSLSPGAGRTGIVYLGKKRINDARRKEFSKDPHVSDALINASEADLDTKNKLYNRTHLNSTENAFKYVFTLRTMVVIYDITDISIDYSDAINLFKILPLSHIGFNTEKCKEKNYLKVLVNLKKTTVFYGSEYFFIKETICPTKIIIGSNDYYNYNSFLSGDTPQFFQMKEGKEEPCEEKEFQNGISRKTVFFTNEDLIPLSDILNFPGMLVRGGKPGKGSK
ncbi:MAG: hypothetical protein MJ252_31045 [archaeon]|nr:hypothetical protein [archaeon]